MLYAGRGRTPGHPRADVGGLLGTDAWLVMEMMIGPKDFVERTQGVQSNESRVPNGRRKTGLD